MNSILTIISAFLLIFACLILGVAVGLCAAIGLFASVWGPEALLGPPPRFSAFVCFSSIAVAGMMMAWISVYVLVILPLSIRLNSWALAGCNGRLIAYYAKGICKLMKGWEEYQNRAS